MSFRLLDLVKNQLNDELVSKAASFLGENENGVRKALSGIIPSVLTGLVSRGTSGIVGANELLNTAKDTHRTSGFNNPGSLLNNSTLLTKGAELLKNLLGDRTNSIVSAIAGFAGIKPSSANSLMSMAAPTALSTVGKHATEENLSAAGLMELLGSQKSTVLAALAGVLPSVAGMLGTDQVRDIKGGATRKVAATYDEVEEKSGGIKWLLPFLVALAAALLIWWFLLGGQSGCSGNKASQNDTTKRSTEPTAADINNNTSPVNVKLADGKVDSVTGDFIYNLGNLVTIELPNNGAKLAVGENSTEAKLVAFLNDANGLIDTVKGNWFEFTNVRFKTGSAEITEESMSQLQNMVAIVKAYPSARFKFGGYTDNSGDSVKNVALSQKRAEAVASKVKQMGAASESIAGAEGYGPQWPIADNATPDGRAMNRRVAVSVKAK